MMKNPDFSDLHKFFVSLGVILIGLSFGFLWLFALSPISDTYYFENLYKFIPSAQELALKKIDLYLKISDLRWLFFGLMLTIGIILVLLGIKKWIVIQQMIDFRQEKEYEKEKASVELINAEILEDVNLQSEAYGIGGGGDVNPSEEVIHKYEELKREKINRYKENEMYYLNDLINLFPEYTPYLYYKVNDHFFDLFLISNNSEQQDIAIELKIINTSFSVHTIAGMANQLRQKLSSLVSREGKKPIGCLVFLYEFNSHFGELEPYPYQMFFEIQGINNKYNPQGIYLTLQRTDVFDIMDNRLKRFMLLNGINERIQIDVG